MSPRRRSGVVGDRRTRLRPELDPLVVEAIRTIRTVHRRGLGGGSGVDCGLIRKTSYRIGIGLIGFYRTASRHPVLGLVHERGLNHKDQIAGDGIVDLFFIRGDVREVGIDRPGNRRKVVLHVTLFEMGVQQVVVDACLRIVDRPLGTGLLFIPFGGLHLDFLDTLHLHVVGVGVVALHGEIAQRPGIAEVAQVDRIAHIARIERGAAGTVFRANHLRIDAADHHEGAVLRSVRPLLILGKRPGSSRPLVTVDIIIQCFLLLHVLGHVEGKRIATAAHGRHIGRGAGQELFIRQ